MFDTIIKAYVWLIRLVCGFSTMLVMYSYLPEITAHLKTILRPFLVPYGDIIAVMAMVGVTYAVIVAVMESMGD